ncbi:FAD-dependent monooxygenase [Flavobacterium sp. I3-2]|uniref:FAD-dependent monooxygenase n=1 Tax=Flavobacterium sp. I3-2 TaxID=2748319 RepID=UPI0015ACBD4F|nr:FAD-dependent monooxygenase [Flavobacterium sp. I3-2]
MKGTISIIGAGIGGLTTALILKQKGIKPTIFEGSKEIKSVGAGIIIANNAMQVFKGLGIHRKIEKAGNKISFMKITDDQLNNLSKIDLSTYEQKYDVQNTAIHRGVLQKILIDELGLDHIHLSKRLSKIQKSELLKLTFEDNSTIESDIVIGADGIKSVVRNQLFEKSTLRDSKQICWRGICETHLPQKYHNELNEAWGKGKRFGFVKISDKEVYWYALANSKNLEPNNINLADYFSEFHVDIINIISVTNKEKIIVSDVFDLKPIDKWQSKNICLVGDAAHATTPNLGQGACQAIEDAYVLGELLSKNIPIGNAFKKYENIRRKKALAIVNTSWRIGKMAHIENKYGIWLRNLAMKNTPKSVNKKSMDKIFSLNVI